MSLSQDRQRVVFGGTVAPHHGQVVALADGLADAAAAAGRVVSW